MMEYVNVLLSVLHVTRLLFRVRVASMNTQKPFGSCEIISWGIHLNEQPTAQLRVQKALKGNERGRAAAGILDYIGRGPVV